MSRIFLSHSSKDNYEAIALKNWLAAQGWDDVFLDLDPDRGIAAGERWERALYAAATRCEAVIFLITRHWLDSGWCRKEYALARGLNKALFAVLSDPSATLPDEFKGTWQVLDLAAGQDIEIFEVPLPGSHEQKHVGFSGAGLRRLKRGLQKAGLDATFFPWPPPEDPQRAPYRGFRPLETVDAGIYFGRDAPIVEATDRLRRLREGAAPRILVILGASGAGKSSFLRAGLLPRIARDESMFLVLPVIRPERAALFGETGLLASLEAALPGRSRNELRGAINEGAAGIGRELAALAEASHSRMLVTSPDARAPSIVVTIDQAEELFRSDDAQEGGRFLSLLRELLLDETLSVIAVFGIRSDAYDALEHAKPLEGLAQSTLPLLPLPRGAFVEVIERPARRFVQAGGKLAIEPQLTQCLLEDLERGGGSDALPLLAFTLEQLFLEFRQTGALRLSDYHAVGGLRGMIDAAVRRVFARADADPRIPRDREAREILLRRGLIPWLAGIDPDSKSARRNVARYSDIPEEARPLIDLLVEERLLSTDSVEVPGETAAPARIITIEPAHESLLRQWGLLHDWLQEDFGRLVTLEGIKRAARDWDANGQAEGWLVHREQRLAEAQALDARPDIAAKLDAVDRSYLAQCRAEDDAHRAREEHRREEREAEQARRIRDARRLVRRTVAGLVAVSLSAVAVGVFAFYAQHERTVAEQRGEEASRQRRIAVSNESEALAALSRIASAEERPDDAIKLALSSWPRQGDVERPQLETALSNISLALSEHSVPRREHRSDVAIAGLRLDHRGDRLATWSGDGRVTLFDASSLAPVELPERHAGAVGGVLWSHDDRKIISWGEDGILRLSEIGGKTLPPVPPMRHGGTVQGALWSRDDSRILSWSADGTIRLWNAATGMEAIPTIRDVETGGRAMYPGEYMHRGVLWSHDEKRILSWSQNAPLQMWDAASGGRITLGAMRFERPVTNAAWSPDDTRIVSWSANTFRVWDASGMPVGQPVRQSEWILGMSWSHSGNRLVSWSWDKATRLWDGGTATAIDVPAMAHDEPIEEVRWSRDDRRLVSRSADRLRVWDAASGRPVGAPMRHGGAVTGFRWDPKLDRILSWSAGRSLQLWDAATGEAIGPAMRHDAPILGAEWSQDRTFIVSWSSDRIIRRWNASIGRPVASSTRGALGTAPSPDGKLIVSWSDESLQLWDAATGQAIGPPMLHEDTVLGAEWSRDGRRFLSWSLDGTARLWDAASGRQIGASLVHRGPVVGARWSHDESAILSWSQDEAYIWNASTLRPRLPAPIRHDDEVREAVWSRDDTRILSWSGDALQFWDAAKGVPVMPAMRHRDAVSGAIWTRDNGRILSWSADRSLKMWDVLSGRQVGPNIPHEGTLSGTPLSPDEATFVSYFEQRLQFWNARTVTPIGEPIDLATIPEGISWSHDGRRLLLSVGRTGILLDAATGKQVGAPLLHDDSVSNGVWSDDDTRILTWDRGRTIRLWDVHTTKQIGPALLHRYAVNGARWNRNGSRIVSWASGAFHFWDTDWPRGNLLEIACAVLPDDDLKGVAMRFGVNLDTPICAGRAAPADVDWTSIRRSFTRTE